MKKFMVASIGTVVIAGGIFYSASALMIPENVQEEYAETYGEEEEEEEEEEVETEEANDDLVEREIHMGHATMNGYVMYGWDHSNFNLENLKAAIETRPQSVEDALEDVTDPSLHRDFEDILSLWGELEANVDDVEERNRLVHELQKIYRDLDYYVRENARFDPPNITHYGKSVGYQEVKDQRTDEQIKREQESEETMREMEIHWDDRYEENEPHES
ncbi:hypothetical protein [Thalassobacillus sp. C254]|uniref:hypothetical protein n=1 Tax=Thalassobacillus sp. C254 TaxID=1225341 RepID=UPI0006D05F83|nr:hypothetical protein [Thalassobacillus sp. C254]